MKLTKEVLNKIINEEIEKSINEGFLDKIKRTLEAMNMFHFLGAIKRK